jgi:hypothetical protein
MESKLFTDANSHSDNILIPISIYLVLYINTKTVIDNLEVMYIATPFVLLSHFTLKKISTSLNVINNSHLW